MKNSSISKKIRLTPFREAVLKIFESNNHAISIHQIELSLGDHDRITLYRTIKLFLEKGIIHEIALANEINKYALCEKSCSEIEHHHNHIHFKCNKCLEVFCEHIPAFPSVELKGFEIENLEINASGICINCCK